jgi:hypothetical protein
MSILRHVPLLKQDSTCNLLAPHRPCKTLKEHTHTDTHTQAFRFNFVPSISKRGHGALKENLYTDKRNDESKCFRQETEQGKVARVEY